MRNEAQAHLPDAGGIFGPDRHAYRFCFLFFLEVDHPQNGGDGRHIGGRGDENVGRLCA